MAQATTKRAQYDASKTVWEQYVELGITQFEAQMIDLLHGLKSTLDLMHSDDFEIGRNAIIESKGQGWFDGYSAADKSQYDDLLKVVKSYPHLYKIAGEVLQLPEYLAEKAKREAAWKAELARRAAMEKKAEREGGEVCTRCGGTGDWAAKPGYTCYECGGTGVSHAHTSKARR